MVEGARCDRILTWNGAAASLAGWRSKRERERERERAACGFSCPSKYLLVHFFSVGAVNREGGAHAPSFGYFVMGFWGV